MGSIAFVLMPETGAEWVTNAKAIASFIAWIAVLLGGLAAIARFSLKDVPGGRKIWKLYRYLFADPWHRRRVASLEAAMKPTIDAATAVLVAQFADFSAENTREHQESWHRLDTLEQRTAVIEAATAVHSTLIDRGADRLDQMVNQNADVLRSLDELKKQVSNLRTPTTQQEPHHAQ